MNNSISDLLSSSIGSDETFLSNLEKEVFIKTALLHSIDIGIIEDCKHSASREYKIDGEFDEHDVAEKIEEEFDVIFSYNFESSDTTYYIKKRGFLVNIYIYGQSLEIFTLTDTRSSSEEIQEEIKEELDIFILSNDLEEGEIKLLNTIRTDCGRVSFEEHNYECPDWKEIRSNYADTVKQSVKNLQDQNLKKGDSKGSLIIFHGPTGTGKTYFLKTYLKYINNNYNYGAYNITDPQNYDISYYHSIHNNMDSKDLDGGVIIMEDSADLLLSESRGRRMGKLEQFLNFTDGLISVGKNLLYIVTFNEPIKSLDPAILRYGRCLSSIHFKKFPASQAGEWLRGRGIENPDLRKDSYSLAELYNKLDKNQDISFDGEGDKAGF